MIVCNRQEIRFMFLNAFDLIVRASFVFVVLSCAKVSIVSNPSEADVMLQNADKGAGKKLGKTPYNISISELESYVKDGPSLITVSKEGFETQSYLVPYFNFADLNISLNLKKSEEVSSDKWTLINRLVRISLLAYQSVVRQEADSAKKLVEGLDLEYPGFAAPWLIRALTSIQEGKTEEAKGFLSRARDADPLDPNITTLLDSLKDQ